MYLGELNMKIIALLAVPVMTAGMSMLATSPASAHTPSISADCNGVHVSGTAYDPSMQNRWSVTIDGATQSGTFGESFDQTFPVPQDGATATWSAYVEAADGSYHGDGSGTVGPCGGPAVEDVCADLPGNQPAGTECTPPPDVQRTEEKELDGCRLTFQGTEYGAGHLTWDEEYTDTYAFNEQTNTWDLVTDTTATVTNVEFAPWTKQEQVDRGCMSKPKQPPAEHSRHTTTRLDCDDDVRVTTTVSVTTPYVYDARTNTWVPGKPVRHVRTQTSPVKRGECGHTTATPPSGSHTPSGPQVLPASAATASVPTVVDAGLTTAPAAVPAMSPTAATVHRSRDIRIPALLLCGGLLLGFGALRARRS